MEYQKRQCRKSDRKKRTGAGRRDSEYEEEKKVKEVKRKRGRMWVKEEKGGGGDELGWVCVTWDTASVSLVLLQLCWKH